MLGAYGQDKLNENGKLMLGFTEKKKLALLNTFFCTPKNGVSYTFQSANRSKGQARLDYILTKQADRRLIRCVNVRWPPLEAPEPDHNLVYVKVRIPRRFAPNRRKRDGTKETPKLADLRRLILTRTFDARLRTRWLMHYHQSPMASVSVISPPTWSTSYFPLRPNWCRALSAQAEHRVGARGPVWKLR